MKEWKIEKRRRLERCVLRGDILLAIDRDGLCITYALELKGGQAQNQLQPILLSECIGRTIEQVSYDWSENPNSLHVKMRCIHAEEIIQPADHVAQVCSLLVF